MQKNIRPTVYDREDGPGASGRPVGQVVAAERSLYITIPGTPQVQRRARASTRKVKHKGKTITIGMIHDDERNVDWKRTLQGFYVRALEEAGCEAPFAAEGPVSIQMWCIFPLPKSAHRKTKPVKSRPHTGKRFDVDNLLKIVLDAGNGLLWSDDGQVFNALCQKNVSAQDQQAETRIMICR